MSWLRIAALLVAPTLALANGRPPLTNGVYLSPQDAQTVLVRSTFGLLISHDDGCTFRWVCERAVGYGGEFDPKYAVGADGTIFATTFTGLRVSRDGGCSWATATAELPAMAPGRIADLWIDAIDISPAGEVWVATAESGGQNDVYRSTDNGVTFASAGLPSNTAWWKSLAIARSDPQRIYVTGYQVAPTTRAYFERTDDGGGSWTEVALPSNVVFGATPLIHVAAVDPANPDHLIVTTTESNPPRGDRVYRSVDGGASFDEIVATEDPVRAVVFRAGGSVLVATLASGTYQSAAGGAPPYVKLGAGGPDDVPPQLACLAERADGTLIGCGANWQPDYMAVGRAADPLAWQKLFRFVELAGPLECAAGTTSHTECDPMWPALSQQFGVTGPPAVCGGTTDGPPEIDGPVTKKPGCCDSGGGGSSGAWLLVGVVVVALGRRRHPTVNAVDQLG